MTIREELTIDELIQRIADELAVSCSGEHIVDIANQVLIGHVTYHGDENVIIEREDIPNV